MSFDIQIHKKIVISSDNEELSIYTNTVREAVQIMIVFLWGLVHDLQATKNPYGGQG